MISNFLIALSSIVLLSFSYIALHEFIRLYRFEQSLKKRISSQLERETGLSDVITSNKRKLHDGRVVYLAWDNTNNTSIRKDKRFFQVYINNMQIESFEEIPLQNKKAA